GTLYNNKGDENTAVGWNALTNLGYAAPNSNGGFNTAVGSRAGGGLITGRNNIYLGDNVRAAAQDESFRIRLGIPGHVVYITGISTLDAHSGVPANVATDANGLLGLIPSAARYKDDIESLGHQSAGIYRLRPVRFSYKGDTEKHQHFGLIAEEVD